MADEVLVSEASSGAASLDVAELEERCLDLKAIPEPVGALAPPLRILSVLSAKAPCLEAEPGSIMARMLAGAQLDPGIEPQTMAWRRAEMPSGGGIGNARSVARVHSALACGGSVDGVHEPHGGRPGRPTWRQARRRRLQMPGLTAGGRARCQAADSSAARGQV